MNSGEWSRTVGRLCAGAPLELLDDDCAVPVGERARAMAVVAGAGRVARRS